MRSYFLTNERTWTRKLREAFMAVALELRYDKRDLMHAYVNEIYLGQDGDARDPRLRAREPVLLRQAARGARAARARVARRRRARPDVLRSAPPSDRALERRNLVLQRWPTKGSRRNDDVQKAADRDLDLVGDDAPQRDALGVL